MVATYIYAGLRREEALWLTRADVDLRAGRPGLIYVRAKTINGESWEPKTKQNRCRADQQRPARLPRPLQAPALTWRLVLPEPRRLTLGPGQLLGGLRAVNNAAGTSVELPGLPTYFRNSACSGRCYPL